MGDSAEYLIAQYLHNPMRHEPRNVGIMVSSGASRAGRFVGEISDTGEIDRRSTKWTEYPRVYRKWLRYWREQLEKGGDDFSDA